MTKQDQLAMTVTVRNPLPCQLFCHPLYRHRFRPPSVRRQTDIMNPYSADTQLSGGGGRLDERRKTGLRFLRRAGAASCSSLRCLRDYSLGCVNSSFISDP